MESAIITFVLLFIFVFGGVILTRIADLGLLAADRTMRNAPKLILPMLELMLVIAKAAARVLIRAWRSRACGYVVREPRQEVGPSDIYVRVNPMNTGNNLGHQPAFTLAGTERRRAPVTIEHEPIRR